MRKLRLKTKRERLDYSEFVQLPLRLFRYIGIDFNYEKIAMQKFQCCLCLASIIFILTQQLSNIIGRRQKPLLMEGLSNVNYLLASLGKVCSILYYRRELLQSLADFRKSYPKKVVIRHYNLACHLRFYKRLERFLYIMFHVVVAISNFQPLLEAVYEWHPMPVLISYPWPLEAPRPVSVINYILMAASNYTSALIILSFDLYLFGCISQLRMQLALLALNISELEPSLDNSLLALNALAVRHAQFKKLKRVTNHLFTPSLLFSLLSSTFILYSAIFQLLHIASPLRLLKTFLLLAYELKQVIITCIIGHMLITSSEYFLNALYMHNWTDGSTTYRKQVLFMMMHAHRPQVLSVPGIADVSLSTLLRVVGMAFKLFALLKST